MKITYKKLFPLTKNLTILFAEDDADFREETVDIFEDYFFHVDTAVNGKEALQKFNVYYEENNKYYDIVITDINMPLMNGIELTKEIYLHNKEQSIIVLSAHNEAEYLLELVNMGIEQFLMKPLDADLINQVLYNTAQKVLNNKPLPSTSSIVSLNNNFTWDTKEFLLFSNDRLVKLTKNERAILTLFINKRNKITTLVEIMNVVSNNTKEDISIESLKSIISRLRKKIPNQTIENVYSLGYRLIH